MLKSMGLRYILIGLITVLMSVPLFFASTIVTERANYSRQTTEQLSREWGGSQSLNGAIMVLPVSGPKKTHQEGIFERCRYGRGSYQQGWSYHL